MRKRLAMLIRRLKDCHEITAGDNSVLRELLHPDRQPLGSVAGTLLAFLLSDKAVDLVYTHRVDDTAFTFDSADIRAALGDVPLSHPSVCWWLDSYLQEGEDEMRQGRWEIVSKNRIGECYED